MTKVSKKTSKSKTKNSTDPVSLSSIFISCNYKSSVKSYKSYDIILKNEVYKTFNSGDPVQDWSNLVDYCRKEKLQVLMTSSVDHFVLDSKGKYGWDDSGYVVKLK